MLAIYAIHCCSSLRAHEHTFAKPKSRFAHLQFPVTETAFQYALPLSRQFLPCRPICLDLPFHIRPGLAIRHLGSGKLKRSAELVHALLFIHIYQEPLSHHLRCDTLLLVPKPFAFLTLILSLRCRVLSPQFVKSRLVDLRKPRLIARELGLSHHTLLRLLLRPALQHSEVVTIIFSCLLTLPLRRSRFDPLIVSVAGICCAENRHRDAVLVCILLSSLENGDISTYIGLRETSPPPLGRQA